ncbi:FtsW/RodA/SpoVE family cell cycle protein [Sphingomonas sp. RT2P30]|uniref:FtsW/RodA/SpoVE family cell cycle protein n=1 Tax=Parasphingomonas halimpatiens TaxID=3096162 RepID=UPI002FCA4E40
MSGRAPDHVARALLWLAGLILPPPLRHWGMAMRHELDVAGSGAAACRFALGCLGSAVRVAAAYHVVALMGGNAGAGIGVMSGSNDMMNEPRHLVFASAAGATLIGLAQLALAGAPLRYLAINAAALVIGVALVGIVTIAARAGRAAQLVAAMAPGLVLLATSQFGVSIDGATRWIGIAGIQIQPSMMLMPALAIHFAATRDRLGALAAGMVALALARPERVVLAAAAAALAGFAVVLAQPDRLPAVRHVEQVLFSSFAVHPLAGVAVVLAMLLMIAPAWIGYRRDRAAAAPWLVFGAVWLGVIAAAALGNYPTPLVGYGGSAIIGYVLGLAALPRWAAPAGSARHDVIAEAAADPVGRHDLVGASCPA